PARAQANATTPAPRGSNAKLAACALLLGCVAAITLGAGAVRHYLDDTAAQLLDREAYVHAVLPAPSNVNSDVNSDANSAASSNAPAPAAQGS
ncbi:hypothetical protein G3N97_04585, partial [Paraburkholderia sp. Ac-20347]|nr:hypothetical protein [Paraburkholderia sp. Ac-20347]